MLRYLNERGSQMQGITERDEQKGPTRFLMNEFFTDDILVIFALNAPHYAVCMCVCWQLKCNTNMLLLMKMRKYHTRSRKMLKESFRADHCSQKKEEQKLWEGVLIIIIVIGNAMYVVGMERFILATSQKETIIFFYSAEWVYLCHRCYFVAFGF